MVKFSFGLLAKYEALAVKDADTLYFITDAKKIYKGDTVIAECNLEFTTTQPTKDNTEVGKLYIYTDDQGQTTTWTKVTEDADPVQVGGGKATEVADGVLTVDNFNPDAIASEITADPDAASDTKIPTEKAVSTIVNNVKTTLETTIAGYDVAYVDVSAGAHTDAGTVLTFTTKGGETKEVTIADLFLKSASYDAGTHVLALTVQGSATPVTIDLSDLVGASFSDIVIGEDEAFTVELGAGGTLGGFKTGDTVNKDTSLESIVKKLLMKQVPPTYTQPTIAIANNSGTAAGNYEYGTTITPKLRATFTKNDAGDLTSIVFKKGTTQVGEEATASPATVEDTEFNLTATVSYNATASYAEGAIKNDNLGDPYPTGHIAAGSKTSGNYTFTPFRRVFYGVSSDKPELNSAYIRGLTAGDAYSKNKVLNFTATAGTQRVTVAVLKSATSNKPKFETTTGLTLDVSGSFTSTDVNVEGANGSTAVAYTVWTYEPTSPYASDTAYRVTLQ